jgi:membrane-associated protease RseP (regulator of RpoE activity)
MVIVEQSLENSEQKNTSTKRIEFHFPIIMLKTRTSIGLMTRLGRLKTTKGLAWVCLAIFPLMAIVGTYLFVSAIQVYLSIPAAGQAAREVGFLGNILIPGLNPYLPFLYGWVALAIAIVVHEGGHGVVARSLKQLVKSAGLVFVLILPIGAFVETDDAALKKAKLKDALRILAAGVGSNVITAIVFLLLLITIVSSLTPIVQERGLGVVGVVENYPAYNSGLNYGDILVSVNGNFLREAKDLGEATKDLKPNDFANLTFIHDSRLEHRTVRLAENPTNSSKSFLGVQVVDNPADILEKYNNISNSLDATIYLITPTILSGPYFVPYSHVLHVFYESPIGDFFYPLSNLFYWIWFINLMLAIFNALPIYPLDGGHVLLRIMKRVFKGKMKESTSNYLTYIVSLVMISIVLLTLILPYL